MNILITGCDGFLGREATSYFKERGHNVIATNRHTLDVSNLSAVTSFFDRHSVDVVIHAAIVGGRRNVKDEFEHLMSNIGMYANLAANRDSFGVMFNFGSGAEFDRSYIIEEMHELDIYERMPQDYYGLSKNVITREINKTNNIINLRLFGCFGVNEHPDRFIKNSLYRLQSSQPIIIHENKEMDFVFVEDVFRIIEFMSASGAPAPHQDFNVCYQEKHTLLDIAQMITSLTLTKIQDNIIIEQESTGISYTGNADRLHNLGIELCGLNYGLEEMIKRN